MQVCAGSLLFVSPERRFPLPPTPILLTLVYMHQH